MAKTESKLKDALTPDPKKEQKIAEIFNLKEIEAPNEKHLEKRNGLKEWGNRKLKR